MRIIRKKCEAKNGRSPQPWAFVRVRDCMERAHALPARMPQASLRIVLWVAVFAFFAGFTGYLAVQLGPQGRAEQASFDLDVQGAAYATPARLAPPSEPWAFEKAI